MEFFYFPNLDKSSFYIVVNLLYSPYILGINVRFNILEAPQSNFLKILPGTLEVIEGFENFNRNYCFDDFFHWSRIIDGLFYSVLSAWPAESLIQP